MLQEADTAGTADKMAAVVQGLQAQMAARITEIGTQIQAMQAQLAADTAAKGEWEQKMVDLSDEHVKALNDASTADLTRNRCGVCGCVRVGGVGGVGGWGWFVCVACVCE